MIFLAPFKKIKIMSHFCRKCRKILVFEEKHESVLNLFNSIKQVRNTVGWDCFLLLSFFQHFQKLFYFIYRQRIETFVFWKKNKPCWRKKGGFLVDPAINNPNQIVLFKYMISRYHSSKLIVATQMEVRGRGKSSVGNCYTIFHQ